MVALKVIRIAANFRNEEVCMRKIVLGLLGSLVLSAVFAGVASAASSATPTIPTVSNVAKMRSFSPESDYMSLPGYFRYLSHLASGQWLTYKDAAQAVQSVLMSGPGS
jgi:hypothetical protein